MVLKKPTPNNFDIFDSIGKACAIKISADNVLTSATV